MIVKTNCSNKSTPKAKRSTICVLTATLLVSSALTSCDWLSPRDAGALSIYAPDVLRIKKGQEIKTLDGTYTPQNDEIYHSDKRFRELERQLIYRTK